MIGILITSVKNMTTGKLEVSVDIGEYAFTNDEIRLIATGYALSKGYYITSIEEPEHVYENTYKIKATKL